jgi:hypothetical protein
MRPDTSGDRVTIVTVVQSQAPPDGSGSRLFWWSGNHCDLDDLPSRLVRLRVVPTLLVAG